MVVPHDTLYPDGKTEEQSTQENAEEFSQSQESAKVAALEELKIPVTSRVVVSTVVKDSAAEGVLHAGDVIKAVDGTAVEQPEDVAKLVTKHKPGEDVVFTVIPAKTAAAAEKAGKEPEGSRDVTLTTRKCTRTPRRPSTTDRAIVGIQAGTDHTFPFEIDIKLADVGGPSAGLMFSLGIVDKLTPRQADRRQVRRRHRHHRRRRQGRPDRRDQHEAGRRARHGRPVLPDARTTTAPPRPRTPRAASPW